MRVQGRNFDGLLTLFAVALTFFGCIAIFDAGFVRSLQGGSAVPHEFKMQVIFAVLGLMLFTWTSVVRADVWRKWTPVLFVLSILSLIAVELVGVSQNGAQRWLKFGPIMVQPAEFMKVVAILFLALHLATRSPWQGPKRPPRDWAEKLDKIVVPKLARMWPVYVLGFVFLLIEREKDLGTAAVVAATAFTMCSFGGASRASIIGVALCGAVVVGGFAIKEPYRIERITSHFHRWEDNHLDDIGYQTTQSETAMASGGLIGAGIGAGRAKHMLPAATTDFVFATIAEETGLLGVLVILGLMGGVVWRLMVMARVAASPFGRMVCMGTAIWLTVQAVTNLMMANGTLPAIGIPFPFVSSGGSSLLAIWVALGICQSAYAENPQEEEVRATRRYRWRHRRSRLSRA